MTFSYFKRVLLKNTQYLILRKSYGDMISVNGKIRDVKPKLEKGPFMKNVLLGNVDKDLLSFPEVEISEYINSLKEKLPESQSKAVIVEESAFMRLLKSGICRLGIPEEFGGIPSHSTNFIREVEKIDINLTTSFLLETQYSLIIKTLLKYGSDHQKKQYLNDLVSGNITAAYAAHEDEAGSDPPSLQCTVCPKDFTPETSYVLNGHKSWIANASIAKFFIVLAQYNDHSRPSDKGLLSAFIVDRDTPGICIEKQEDNASKCDIGRLKFNNIELPHSSMLGDIGSGYEICVSCLESNKYIFSASILNLIRKLLSEVTTQVLQTNRYPQPLREYELVLYRLSKITTILYALESSVYLLTGMEDIFTMDTSLESVIVQNLMYTYGKSALEECINIAGIRTFDNAHYYKSALDNFSSFIRAFSSPEILKLYIALKGIEYVGRNLADIIKKSRNPFNYPGFVLRRMLQFRKHASDSPKLNKNLYMHLHPSLKFNADKLEYSICRLQYSVEVLLSTHGTELVHRQLHLLRVSDIVSDIFTMVAVLTRSSRAYCTGIRFADQEILVSNAWCQDTMKRVQANVSETLGGQINFSDYAFLQISPDVLQNKGYFFESPVEKNIV